MRKQNGEERESSLASGWTVRAVPSPDEAALVSAPAEVSEGSETSEGALEAAPERPNQVSNAALVLLGVFGGLFLLYAWIWMSWAQYYAPVNANLAKAAGALGGPAQQIVFWLAPLAPILWFAATLFMNWGKGMRRLVLWLVIGAIVLVPLPIFSGGAL